VGGRPEVRLDLSTPRRLDERDCFVGPGTGVQIWYAEPADKYFVLLRDTAVSVYIVDVDGQRQVFVTGGSVTSDDNRRELQAALDSIAIES